jgi:hypothetical protein
MARLVACEESIPIPVLAFLRCTPSVHGRSYVCTWVYKCAPINLKKILKYLCVLIYSFRLGVYVLYVPLGRYFDKNNIIFIT